MEKFRFYVHTWSPLNGHADRKIVLRGATMDAALQMMIKVLEAREPGVIVNAKSYEKVTV